MHSAERPLVNLLTIIRRFWHLDHVVERLGAVYNSSGGDDDTTTIIEEPEENGSEDPDITIFKCRRRRLRMLRLGVSTQTSANARMPHAYVEYLEHVGRPSEQVWVAIYFFADGQVDLRVTQQHTDRLLNLLSQGLVLPQEKTLTLEEGETLTETLTRFFLRR